LQFTECYAFALLNTQERVQGSELTIVLEVSVSIHTRLNWHNLSTYTPAMPAPHAPIETKVTL
jgi:hypothetical protein